MSIAAERRREYETLAWITDDEAEFWTVNIRSKASFFFRINLQQINMKHLIIIQQQKNLLLIVMAFILNQIII
jgi:hypothetical protein